MKFSRLDFPAGCMAAGCGAAYQASTQIRSHRMLDSLKAGQTMPEVRQEWGQPDIITDQGPNTETWSYASRPNTNDIAATLLYTAAKEGDTGEFLDLRFVNGKLVSWSKRAHTMAVKRQNFRHWVRRAQSSRRDPFLVVPESDGRARVGHFSIAGGSLIDVKGLILLIFAREACNRGLPWDVIMLKFDNRATGGQAMPA